MAIIKPNQPVLFTETDALVCNSDVDYYEQIVDNTDDTQFQMGLTICNGSTQVLDSPNFDSSSDFFYNALAWSITSNVACSLGAYASAIENATELDSTKYYRVSITVDSVTSGSFDVYLGSTYLGNFSQAGSYTWYGFPTPYLARHTVRVLPVNATDVCCMSAMEAYVYLTNFIFAIYDSEDNYVDEISYSANPEYFTFVQDSLTVTINWSELGISNGCYYLCLLDPCDNTNGQNYPAQITNGTFTGSATGWTLASAWTYGSNAVSAVYSGTPANNVITQSNVFTNYTTTYSVTVVLTAHTGNVSLYFGTAYVGNCTGVGTFVITGIPVGNLDLQMRITSGTATVTSVTANEVSTANYTCNATSNIFKLGDYISGCPNTILINACNDDDGLGFIFNGSSFSPRLRLEGQLQQAKYQAERVTEEDSYGTKKIIYYRRRKQKSLVADLLPEYIHDFLSTLIGYDKFYIDGTQYISDDDEYNVTYHSTQTNVGSVSMLVSEQTQLIRNINCSDQTNSCSLDGNYLMDADTFGEYITLVNGELIEING